MNWHLIHCTILKLHVHLFYLSPFGDNISMLKEFCTCQHVKDALNATTFQKVNLQIQTNKQNINYEK